MALPPEISALAARFNIDFPPYSNEATELLKEYDNRRELFTERFVQARRQLKAGDLEAGNAVASYELISSSEFNDEWLNRYSFSNNRFLDKLNSMFSQMHAASDDPIYAQALWAALKLDDYVSIERSKHASMQEFKESLTEFRFNEVQHKEAQEKAISSMEAVIKGVEYGIMRLMRAKIALWKGENPNSETPLDDSQQRHVD